MQTTDRIFILLATIALSRIVHARVSQSNAEVMSLTMTLTATNIPPTNNNRILPLIQMKDVPMTPAIENLAKQTDINHIVDPKLFPLLDSKGNPIPQPLVTLQLTNVSPKDALTQMLNLHNIAMIEDPVTHVSRITRANPDTKIVNASLLHMETNSWAFSSNGIIPLIQFQDVPIDLALNNLIQQGAMKIEIDPRLAGVDISPDSPFIPSQLISIRWRNITAKQAIVALCENYDLVIVKDDATGAIQIKPSPKTKN